MKAYWLSARIFILCVWLTIPIARSKADSSAQTQQKKVNAYWVAPDGQLSRDAKVQKSEWVWDKHVLPNTSTSRNSLALRVWLKTKLPPTWQIKQYTVEGAVIQDDFRKIDSQLVIDLLSTEAVVKCEILNDKNETVELSLLVLTNSNKLEVVTRPECQEMADFSVTVEKAKSKTLFLGIDCEPDEGKAGFYFFRSLDSKWEKSRSLAAIDSSMHNLELVAQKSSEASQNNSAQIVLIDNNQQESKISVDYKSLKVRAPKTYSISPSLGITAINHTQSNFSKYTAIALTAKVAFQKQLPWKTWDIGINAYATVFNLMTTGPKADARFLGINLRGGYTFKFGSSPYSLSLLGGAFYTTVFTSGAKIGYGNLLYPQFVPVFKRSIGLKNSAFAYLKFVPLQEGIGFSFQEREIAGGVGYSHMLKNLHPLLFSLDASDMRLKFGKLSMTTNTVTFSVGYGF